MNNNFHAPRIYQHCGYYAKVERRTTAQGWHVAEWGECRKNNLNKTGTITLENDSCDKFIPDPKRWREIL